MACVATCGFSISRYRGLFANQNGTGETAAALFCVSSACLLDNFKTKTKGSNAIRFMCVFSMLVSLVFAFVSTSRGSLVAILICFAFFLFFLARQMSGTILIRFLVASGIIASVVFLIYRFTSIKESVDFAIDKFKNLEDDPLNGREQLWGIVMSRLSWYGNGEASSFGVHNTYLSMIDQYGIFSGFIWIAFCVFALLKSLVLCFSTKAKIGFKYLPFFAFMVFCVQSLTEGVMLKTIMLISMFSVSLLYNDSNSQKSKLSTIDRVTSNRMSFKS